MGKTCSPGRRSRSRDVTRTFTPGAVCRISPTSSTPFEQVFKVVQNQQHLTRLHVREYLLPGRAAVAEAHLQRKTDRLAKRVGQLPRLVQWRQLGIVDAVGKTMCGQLPVGRCQRQTRLAHAARPNDGDEPNPLRGQQSRPAPPVRRRGQRGVSVLQAGCWERLHLAPSAPDAPLPYLRR